MTVNTELFKKIDERLDEDEMFLEMSTWEDSAGSVCGTTRCVSGWALHERYNQPLYIGGIRNPFWEEVAEQLGVEDDFEQIGRELLGLSRGEAAVLFFTDNEKAREVVRLFAQGKNEEARLRLDQD